MSDLEDALVWQIKAVGLPDPEREYVFARPRRWRFDLAWPALRIAVEVEGGTWTSGAHSRGVGIFRDVTKYNEAALLGWTLLRVTSNMVHDGTALLVVERAHRATHRDWSDE